MNIFSRYNNDTAAGDVPPRYDAYLANSSFLNFQNEELKFLEIKILRFLEFLEIEFYVFFEFEFYDFWKSKF